MPMGFSKAQMWSAVMSLAGTSHSAASGNQRALHKSYTTVMQVANTDLEPPREINVTPVAEQLSGKVLSETA